MVVSLLSRQRDGKAFFSWLFLGPVLMTLSATLAVLFSPCQPLFLAILLVGLFSTIFFDKVGLLVSCTSLFVVSILTHLNQDMHHLWLLSIEISMLLGLFLSNLSFQEAKHLFSIASKVALEITEKAESLQDQILEGKAHFERYKGDTAKEFVDLRNQEERQADLLLSYRKLTDLLTERDKQNRELRDSYDKDMLKKDKEIITLKYSIETYRKQLKLSEAYKMQYLNGLNDLRHTLYQKRIIDDHKLMQMRKMVSAFSQKNVITELEKKHLEKKLVHSQSQIKKLCIRLDELSLRLNEKINDPKHIQLKKQFDEKNVVLHDTRNELFHAKEIVAALQKKAKEKSLFISKDVDIVMQELDDMEQEAELLKRENEALNSLVSLILKKQKVIAVEQELPFL